MTKPGTLGIEPAGPDDVPVLVALHGSASSRPWDVRSFEAFIADRACTTLIARDPQGDAVGFVTSRAAADEAEILMIAVQPDRRRAGVGAALLEALMLSLLEHGVAALFLEVGHDNIAARALYQRFGFRQVARRAGYYRAEESGVRQDALVLKRALDPAL